MYKDELLILFAEDDWSDESCPICDYDFTTDEWEQTGHGGDYRGGQARYTCPRPSCDGRASVNY